MVVNVGTKDRPIWRYVLHTMKHYDQGWRYE